MADGLVITGPTASGKTALAIEVAQRLGGEIISMDSRQVYAGMDIGTAKPSKTQLAAVPHYGIDMILPGQRYSAGRFAADARAWLQQIRARARVPLLVGGTGFFLRALTQPMFEEPPLDARRKEALKRYLEGFTRAELLHWLGCLDEDSAARLQHEGGRQRLARALEIALLTGKPLSEWHRAQQPAPGLRFLVFVLEMPRSVLYERINARVDEMLASGLVAEVKGLRAAGYDRGTPGMDATGYIEILRYLNGEIALAEAADEIRAATRRYARRQITWFRHQLPPDTITLDAMRPVAELADVIVHTWQGGVV